ncbi:VWA domain-containing protein [uncultured Cohaesibacter sp.]|uniref:VWA domain-containing protein n=1 Tax=uncultured Cohaesibacter sp. TaxID=1002546 RepID=UPI00293057C5|nr:VWA domain-containing protein [uncultured Cohaesibacter sp.]
MANKRDELISHANQGLSKEANEGSVASFLAKTKLVRQAQAEKGLMPVSGRLIFAMDATMSRQPTWDVACSVQADMFEVAQLHGSLATQLVYFRGTSECRASRWTRSAKEMTGWMERFDCRAGRTQLGRILQHVKNEARQMHIDAVVYVGDCLEEDPDRIVGMADDIGRSGIPVFVFQEGADPMASDIFRQIARLTGGAYGQFDANAKSKLANYLKGIAAFAASGRDVTRLPDELRKQLPGPKA